MLDLKDRYSGFFLYWILVDIGSKASDANIAGIVNIVCCEKLRMAQ